MIRIEDDFEDVIGKAMAGLGLDVAALAEASALDPDRIESLLNGRINDEALLSVAPALGLAPQALVDMAHQHWQPSVELPDWVALFNTPFPVCGYEAMTVNSYLFWSGREAVAVDAGAHADPLLAEVAQRGLELKALYLTHTHRDHIAALDTIRAAYSDITVYAPKGEAIGCTVPLAAGARMVCGSFGIELRLTPGHSPAALSYIVEGADRPIAFVGDAIFCLSMGKAPDAYAEALASNRSQLLTLPGETLLCPGHGPITTVADERARNPFFAE